MLQGLEAAPPKDLTIFSEISLGIYLEAEIHLAVDEDQIKGMIFNIL